MVKVAGPLQEEEALLEGLTEALQQVTEALEGGRGTIGGENFTLKELSLSLVLAGGRLEPFCLLQRLQHGLQRSVG